jgi:hypothetical protein
MDLSLLNPKKKANAGAPLHLIHPETGLPMYHDDDTSKPVRIFLMGRDSDFYQKVKHKNVNEALSQKKKTEQKTSEKIEQETTELIADLTVGWENLTYDEKGISEFSRQNAITLYTDFAWVKEQADLFVSDRKNFI